MIDIKKRREELGLTQTDIAQAVGAGINTVRGWEKGSLPMPKWRKALAEILKCGESEIEVYDA